jgi:hypothetical protein
VKNLKTLLPLIILPTNFQAGLIGLVGQIITLAMAGETFG